MVRPEVVRRKLSLLSGYLSELRVHAGITLDAYLAPGGPRREIERLLQLVVEAAVDINTHVVVESGAPAPVTYHDSFIECSKAGVIPGSLAARIAPSAGLRNAIVHGYGSLDDERVHSSIDDALALFGEYVSRLAAWLDSRDQQ